MKYDPMTKMLVEESNKTVDASISVYTGPWSNANGGKQPRGNGYWAFAYRRNPDVDEMFFFSGSYADAKKKAIEKAKADGKTAIYVLS